MHSTHVHCLSLQWHWDVNQKVMLTNEKPIPILLLANKVRQIFCCAEGMFLVSTAVDGIFVS